MSKLRKTDVPLWQSRPILEADHVSDLESSAAQHEFRDRKPRQEAETLAHDSYRKKHSLEAGGHHFRAMKAAQASGDNDAAQKHAAMYGMHLRALGMDPYGPVPSEIKSRAESDDKHTVTRFKPHPGDALLLQPTQKSERGTLNLTRILDLEPDMSDKKTKPDLRKFYDDMYAKQGADLRKAEKLTALAKALALAGQILQKEESPDAKTKEVHARQDTFDARKNKAHAFEAIDGGKFAPRKDRETCAHCGESVGHKSHHSSYGVPHKKSEQDLEKAGWKSAIAGAAMLAAPIAATVGARQALHNDVQGVNQRYEDTLRANTSAEFDAKRAARHAAWQKEAVQAAPSHSAQGAVQGAALAGLKTVPAQGASVHKDEDSPGEEHSPEESSSGSPEESSREKVQDEAHLYGKAEESAGEHSPHENIKSCPKCGVKTNDMKSHIAQDHGKHKVKKSEEIEKLRKSAEDAVKYTQGFVAQDLSKSTGVMAKAVGRASGASMEDHPSDSAPEASPEKGHQPPPGKDCPECRKGHPHTHGDSDTIHPVKKSTPEEFSAQEAKALLRKYGEESAQRIMWAAHNDFHGRLAKSEKTELSKAEKMAALKIRIGWSTQAPSDFKYEE